MKSYDEEDDPKNERETMQEQTFRRWANTKVKKGETPVFSDLFTDLKDGRKLINLVDAVGGEKLPRDKGKSRTHYLNNVNRVLQYLQEKNVKTSNLNPADIVDGNPKITLATVWAILQFFWQIYVEQEHLDAKNLTLEQALLRWCRQITKGVENVDIRNFTTCWRDGFAFNALIHKCREDLLDYDNVRQLSVDERLGQAFKLSENHFQVATLLDVGDVNSDHLDKKSIITYVMCLFQALPFDRSSLHLSPSDSPIKENVVATPSIETTTETTGAKRRESKRSSVGKAPKILQEPLPPLADDKFKDHQNSFEEVLIWLLDAEEKLQHAMPVEGSELSQMKAQFKNHEEFMIDLTKNQGSVGDALNTAGALLSGDQLNDDEKVSVRKQMYMLNDKWEAIRGSAMRRQSMLQKNLMTLQNNQIDGLLNWLSSVESLLSRVEAPGTDPEVLKQQCQLHQDFQTEIEKQQPIVKSLADVIIIVEDTAAEGGEKSPIGLEIKLKEVGKRWQQVCQTVESRLAKLTKLRENMQFLNESGRHFADWLDQREAALASLKSAHHLTSQKEVFEQVKNLQVMQQDLESEHPRFVQFCRMSTEAASLLDSDNPVAANAIRRLLDEVSQRWENLVCRMDEQLSILVRSGKVDPRKIKVPKVGFGSNPNLSMIERTIDQSLAIVKKHVFIECEHKDESVKRKKVSLSTMPGDDEKNSGGDFDRKFIDFCRWLDKIETNLALSIEDLTQKEQLESYEILEKDIRTHEPILETLHTTAHEIAEQIRTDGGNAENVESKLHEVNSRWRDLCLVLAERKRKLQYSADLERFGYDLRQIDDVVTNLNDWVERFEVYNSTSDSSDTTDKAKADFHECQSQLEIVKQKEQMVESLHNRLTKLTEQCSSENDAQLRSLQKRFDKFTEKWANVVEKLSSSLEQLTANISKSRAPNIEEALYSLTSWLDTAEDLIATQDLESLESPETTQVKIERLKELQGQLYMQKDSVSFISSAAEELIAEKADSSEMMSMQLVNIGPRWADIDRVVKSQLNRLESGYEKMRDWDCKVADLNKWMDQVTEFVHAEQPAVGSLETLKVQLEQSQGLVSDIETLRPKMQQAELTVDELVTQTTNEMSQKLKTQMDQLDQRFTDVVRLAKAKHDGLQDVYARSQKIFDDIQQLTKWLTTVEEELNSPIDAMTGKELQTMMKRNKQLKDELNSRSDTVDAAVCLAEEMVCSLEGSAEAGVQLRAQLHATRQQWSAICRHVEDKLQALHQAFEEWRELQELLAAEKINLDQLERKLNEPPKSAADAEEYSEQLDLLERLMEGDGNHARIKTISSSLIQKDILKQAVEQEMSKYDFRREKILPLARERQIFLEAGVRESQEFEQQLLNCQSWVSHVDYILSARLNSDIMASDVPQEYKQLQTEFDEHDQCLTSLESQSDNYRLNGKTEAANRLTEQVDHVKKQVAEVKTKFERFKKPTDNCTMLERLWKVAKNIEHSIVLLKITSDNVLDLEGQVEKSKQIHKTLMDMRVEVDVIALNERQLSVQPNIDQINEIYAACVSLESKVIESERDLIRASELLKRLDSDLDEMSCFLDVVESDLKKWQTYGQNLLKEDLPALEETLLSLRCKENTFLPEANSLSNEWMELMEADGDSTVAPRVENVKSRLGSLKFNLSRMIDRAKGVKADQLTVKVEYDSMISDVKKSLDLCEFTITDLESFRDLAEKEKIDKLKILSNDVNSLRSKMSTLRGIVTELKSSASPALDPASKSTIDKDVEELVSRWEDVLIATKDLKRRHEVPSRSPTPVTMIDTTVTSSVATAALASPLASASTRPLPSPRHHHKRPTSAEPSPSQLAALGSEAQRLVENIKAAKVTADTLQHGHVESANLDDLAGWKNYLEECDTLLSDLDHKMTMIKVDGQSLAETGPRELIVQRILEDIDSIAEKERKIQSSIDEQKECLAQIVPLQSTYESERNSFQKWLDSFVKNFESRDKKFDIKAAQEEFVSKNNELDKLRTKSRSIQSKLNKLRHIATAETAPSDLLQSSQPKDDPKLALLQSKYKETKNRFDRFLSESTTSAKSERKALQLKITKFWDTVKVLKKMTLALDNKLASMERVNLVDYNQFVAQDPLLKTIKEHIEAVELNLEQLEEQKSAILESSLRETMESEDTDPDKIEGVMQTLREHLTKLNAAYNERVRLYEETLENWQIFHKNVNSLQGYLDQIEKHLAECRRLDGKIDREKAETLQKELEKGFYNREAELRLVNDVASQLLKSTSSSDSTLLKEKLESLNQRFHLTAAQIAERRENLEQKPENASELRDDIDELLFWLDESEMLSSTNVDPMDQEALLDISDRVKEKISEFKERETKVKDIEALANDFVKTADVDDVIKQGVLMDVTELKNRLKKLEKDLKIKSQRTDEKFKRCSQFWLKFEKLADWVNFTKGKMETYHSAIIYTPSRIDHVALEKEINRRQTDFGEISRDVAMFSDEARRCDVIISDRWRTAVQRLTDEWSQVLTLFAAMKTSSSSSQSSDTDSKVTPGSSDVPEKKPGTSDDADLDQFIFTEPQTSKPSKHKIEVRPQGSPIAQEEQINLAKDQSIDKEINSETDEEQRRFGSVVKSDETLKELAQIKHWLNDNERENTANIDVSDQKLIKTLIKKQQMFADNLQNRKVQVIKTLDGATNPDVQHRAEILARDFDRCVDKINSRRRELTNMLDESRSWDNTRLDLEFWLNETQAKITGKKVAECSIQELYQELNNIDALTSDIDAHKQQMMSFCELSNMLIDNHPKDDTTCVSEIVSIVNSKWTRLNDNIRVRRAVLEASLRGRNDFQTAMEEFTLWLLKIDDSVNSLDTETANNQLVKDSAYRKNWMELEKDYRAEITAHEDVSRSLIEQGQTLVDSLEKDCDNNREAMVDRLRQIDERWQALVQRLDSCKQRLDDAQEQWERLTGQLRGLLDWIEQSSNDLLQQRNAGGDLDHVKQQHAFCLQLRQNVQEKQIQVGEISKLAQSFLLQQDLRSLQSAVSRMPSDEKLSDEEIVKKNSLRIGLQIKHEADSLGERWPEFLDRVGRWERIIEEALHKMGQFEDALKSADLELSEVESRRRHWVPVTDVKLDDLPNQMDLAQSFRYDLATRVRRKLEDANDLNAQLLANNVPVAVALVERLEALNLRYRQLDTALDCRCVALENALRDFGPSSQHFLEGSVIVPWKRAISSNRIPYYLNMETEKTQWDHPKMAEMMSRLCEFNEVKYSAYRTAMKLRSVQKRLFLDLLNLHDAVAIMAQKKLIGLNDKSMDIADVVMTLLPIYEHIYKNHPELLKSLPLAIDLCLNWLLNVFDPIRNGVIRVLSFKVVLTLMCRASLEDKYKFLFRQVCSPSGGLDHKKLALLIHDCVQIPKYLGEVAAFGGSNIEPSVRSCFEKAKYPQEVMIENFLEWVKQEPQSLVWLPVMHRVAAAEMAKHQSKCNVCKMYPIVGLRYRCLKCFNFDMCQNCFFSQRVAKSHKITHPMQEYCIASTSGEDVRDFGRVVKNKFRRRRYFRSHPRLGYLPVQTVAEGTPIEVRNTPPFNAQTQDLHSNIDSLCGRLNELDKSQTFSSATDNDPEANREGVDASGDEDEHKAIAGLTGTLTGGSTLIGPGGQLIAPFDAPQSPAQLVSQIDSAQRQEYEALRRRLEEEHQRLEVERDQLQSQLAGAVFSPNGTQSISSPQLVITNGSLGRQSRSANNRSTVTLLTQDGRRRLVNPSGGGTGDEFAMSPDHMPSIIDEHDLLNEARALRQHKDRLEERSHVLDDHNRQLEVQLKRLKHLIEQQQLSEFNVSLAASQPGTPMSSLSRNLQFQNGHVINDIANVAPSSGGDLLSSRMGDLMSTAEDLGKAMGTLVNVMTSDDEESDEEADHRHAHFSRR